MDFGRLHNVDEVDHDLVPDDPSNREYLASFKHNEVLQVVLGLPVWHHKNYLGKIVPTGTPQRDFLYHYARAFPAIELNSTHYALPSAETVKKWCLQTPESFKFCPKLPQDISHYPGFDKRFKDIELFLSTVVGFGKRLGMSFLQLPPGAGIEQFPTLENFIERFPQKIPLSVEFRHTSWFATGELNPIVAKLLRSKHIAAVITDTSGRRDVCHQTLTSPVAFIRFTANSLHSSDFTRLDDWAQRLVSWQRLGLRRCYFFMHQPDEALGVELAQHLAQRLKAESKVHIAAPQTVQAPQQELGL